MKRKRTASGQPMEKWFRSIALIRKIENGKNLWLTRADSRKPGQLNFISAPRLERESFREAVRREVAWVLDLDARRDFLISSVAQLNLEFVACLPTDSSESHIAVAFFLVEIYRQPVLQALARDSRNCWLTSAEVCEGQTGSGQTLDLQTVFLLDRARVINAWD